MVGFQQSMWKSEHDEIIRGFIRDSDDNRLLIFYMDTQKNLVLSRTVPSYMVDQLFYMIRKKGCKIQPMTFSKSVQFQLIRSNYIESLLRMMSSVYGPMFFQNKSWPDSIFSMFM